MNSLNTAKTRSSTLLKFSRNSSVDFCFRVTEDKDVLNFLKNISYTGTYKDFAPMFTGENFDADKWAELFAKAGAQFV